MSGYFVSRTNAVFPCRRVLLAVAFLINAGFVQAQFPVSINHSADSVPAEMRELVSKYCRLDYEGASLDQQSWPKIQPIVWWKSNPDYTQIDVVSRYTVDSEPESNHGKYIVAVHYRLLGVLDLATGYAPEPEGTTQDVSFLVTNENTEWRIADAENTFPHPSRAVMLKWLNDKIASTQDETAKTRYQTALKQLQAQSASPFAK
jgi:hypothetical protein